MRRDQLEHAIRTACQIIEHPAVVMVGSPLITTRPPRLADLIEGIAGEWSSFEEQHGFSIDSVDLTTVVLSDGWRSRLIEVQNANTAAPGGPPRYTGWCLDKADLCVAKLCALREKDQNFVAALLDAGLADSDGIASRLASVPVEHRPAAERALGWLTARP